MRFLRRLFAGRAAEDAAPETEQTTSSSPDQHSLVAWIRLYDAEFANEREQVRLFALEDRVMVALETSGIGTYDTNDLERGFFRMHMFGPDADRLVEVVAPLLAEAPPGSYLAKRAGPAGTSEERVEL